MIPMTVQARWLSSRLWPITPASAASVLRQKESLSTTEQPRPRSASLERAAARGGNAQHGEEILAHGNGQHIARRSAAGERCAGAGPGRESDFLEAPRMPGVLLEIGISGERLGQVRIFDAGVEHVHQARRIFIGERLQKNAAHHAENRRVSADAEGQRENYDGREPRRLTQECARRSEGPAPCRYFRRRLRLVVARP
jgi:hypothetical protein